MKGFNRTIIKTKKVVTICFNGNGEGKHMICLTNNKNNK